jgi:hypothetical protein
MTMTAFITLNTEPGTDVNDAIRHACHIATTLEVEVRFYVNVNRVVEKFRITPGSDPNAVIDEFDKAQRGITA